MKKFKYYFLIGNQAYRAFKLKTYQDKIVVERKYPRKDSQLSRKRGVKYKKEKTTFKFKKPPNIEHLGCKHIKIQQLAPCKKKHTNPRRTIELPEKTESINLHLFTLKPGQQNKLEKHDTTNLGKRQHVQIETKNYPLIGIIITT